jgi:hypothetical protein
VLDKRRVYLNKIVYDICKEQEFILSEKSNHLSIEFEYDYLVAIDLLSFERILTNLLSNAIKFSPPSGKITIRTEPISPKKFRLHVIDSGEGIPTHAMDKIFEKFEQHESRSLGFSGSTGIGLTYCKMAVEAHGGKIGVKKSDKKGADFYIEFEYNDRCLAKSAQNNTIEKPPILVIDNNSRAILYPYAMALVDKDVFEVSEIKNIIKLIDKDNPQVHSFCEQIENSVLNCNQQDYDELLDLVISK